MGRCPQGFRSSHSVQDVVDDITSMAWAAKSLGLHGYHFWVPAMPRNEGGISTRFKWCFLLPRPFNKRTAAMYPYPQSSWCDAVRKMRRDACALPSQRTTLLSWFFVRQLVVALRRHARRAASITAVTSTYIRTHRSSLLPTFKVWLAPANISHISHSRSQIPRLSTQTPTQTRTNKRFSLVSKEINMYMYDM